MVAINSKNYINPDATIDSQDTQTDDVDSAQAAQNTQAVSTSDLKGIANVTATSFEGVKSSATGNVLNTAPPALGNGQQASAADYSEAIARMQQLTGEQPLRSGLIRSTEDGTAPAVPKAAHHGGARTVGASSVDAAATTAATTAAVLPATQNYDTTSTTAANSAAAATDTTNAATTASATNSTTINQDSQDVNVDMSGLDSTTAAASAQISTDAADTKKGACNKVNNVGENALAKRLEGMGLNKTQSKTLAKFLNDGDTSSDSNHNVQEESIVTAAIATYSKLNSAGSKTAATQVVDQLKSVADNFTASVKTQAGSSAYYTSINALGNYALQASANSAVTSLTSTSATSTATIVPYPTIVL